MLQECEFAVLNFIVLNLLYQALTSAFYSYEETTRCYRTEPDQIQPIPKAFRYSRTGYSSDILHGVDGQENACRLRTSAT